MATTDRSSVPAHLRPIPDTLSVGGVRCDLRDNGNCACEQAERPSRLFNVVQQCAVLAFHTRSPTDTSLVEIVREAEEMLGLQEQAEDRPLFERAALCYDELYAKCSPRSRPATYDQLKQIAAQRPGSCGVSKRMVITETKGLALDSRPRVELSVHRTQHHEGVKLRCPTSPRDDHARQEPSTEYPGRKLYRAPGKRLYSLETWDQPTGSPDVALLVC